MAGRTGIEWTDDSWNPTVGCSIVSPGCSSCYAMKMAGRLEAIGLSDYRGLTCKTKAGYVWTGQVRAASHKALLRPLGWRKPRRVFVNSMSDLFHEDMPLDVIDRVFAVMALCPQHVFQVLTKRPERMRVYCLDRATPPDVWTAAREISDWGGDIRWPLSNVWLGTSVEDQTRADERIPLLVEQTPAALRFLSCEPLLGPVTLPHIDALDWVIVGGESGPRARDMDPAWAYSIRDQCREAGVACFVKQMAKRAPIPEDLFVRQFPSGHHAAVVA